MQGHIGAQGHNFPQIFLCLFLMKDFCPYCAPSAPNAPIENYQKEGVQ